MIANSPANLLVVGCGDIGIRLARILERKGLIVAGLRRNPRNLPEFINPVTCDLNDESQVMKALSPGYNYLVLTLTPAERSEAGYRQSFEHNLATFLRALTNAPSPPKHVFFVSSTSVYGQDGGEWVNELSPTKPLGYNGRYVLQAEQSVLASEFNTTVVRFSGIYGPGRERLITKVRQSDWNMLDDHYTNRIHADDCAGVLAFLIERCQSETIAPRYLASDNEPAPYNEVCAWLARQLKMSKPHAKFAGSNQAANKRCDNSLLRNAGYKFRYPSYREGFTAILKEQAF